jgi:holo-[acyl-carrier protein] synthase
MPCIIGFGLDAADIDRVAYTSERYGERFLYRVFTDDEVAYCIRRRVPAIHFAGRFAAKEAAMKALGTGHSQVVRWRGIEVVRLGGSPQLQFRGGAARRFAALGGQSSPLTITHSDSLALAQVLILGRSRNSGCQSCPHTGRVRPRSRAGSTKLHACRRLP